MEHPSLGHVAAGMNAKGDFGHSRMSLLQSGVLKRILTCILFLNEEMCDWEYSKKN